ncbi:MAG: hypothetical protein KDA21_10880, partial [Phycisphaerales bacterium]|nr:hypothetical protein [Phycisphaerales bacterium]
ELHPKSFRLQYVMIDVERGQAVIEIVFRAPDDGSHAGSLGVPVEGRTRLDAIADLHARPGDISVGLPLPDLLMTPWGDVAPEAGVVLGPGALIVFPAWNDDVAAAMTGIRRAVKDKVLERAWPLVVYDLASGNFDDTMAAIGAEVAPFPLHFSLSARSTLRRFSAEGRAALIVVDDHNIVRGIHDIEGGTGADEWYQRIRAALADGDPGE